ncbi:MAG: hypothetical protein J7599_05800 [Niabella sp.]|uniref:hypothetical protein n=1 Tax=Niabella sp. TaxID=1962976 RepID=UPI001B2790F7|nr:hypothetical protein [Niabella sp.]MBO9592406.1 hypothetical protein [Niabella sp.]
MRPLNLTILLIIIVLSSCNRYYLVESSDPVKYSSNDFISSLESEYNTDFVAPYNYFLLRKKKNFGQSNYGIIYGDQAGYISSSNGFTLSRPISKKRYKKKYGASFRAYKQKSNEVKIAYFQKKRAEDDSAYKARSSGSSDTYTPGTGGPVHVQGYYRKDGTYVRPHTRSAPSRRR